MHENLIEELEALRQSSGEIEATLNFVENQIAELKGFNESLAKMSESGDEFLAPIGKGVFVKSKRLERDFLVDAGAGMFVKKTLDETTELINSQIKKLEEIRVNLNLELGKFASELEKIRTTLRQ